MCSHAADPPGGGWSLEMPLLIVGVAALGFNLRGPANPMRSQYPARHESARRSPRADTRGGPRSERTVVPLQSPRDLDAPAVNLGAALGDRNVQSCG